ncbi:WD repeat-containing protein 89 [Uranotaenia lowii]|uniref:WD repeat-containing protein 89 n=1 Tax=Uranotaenia lowii TaxID=190385 RepID=UPI002478376C|nr:WD repeat-containing protein 89 [Uranotaenia lowii]
MFEDHQSSDEENPIPDEDCCNSLELKRLFENPIAPKCELAASLKRTCGLHLSLSSDSQKLAVGLSKNVLQTYQFREDGSLVQLNENLGHLKRVVRGVKFFNQDPNLVSACTEEGYVSLFDLRAEKVVHEFDDSSEGTRKTMTAVDVNQNDRVLCASTDVQKGGDSFLLFFDIRERKYLGCYWESHSEDITSVRFHPNNPDFLASASVDGLVNVFDISQTNEDDAMQFCFNVDNSIEAINWHQTALEKDRISVITTTNDFHLLDVETQDTEFCYQREQITQSIKRKSVIDCNVINAHNTVNKGFIILAGSNYNKGECLRTLKCNEKGVLPHRNFVQNKQIVRASVYDAKENCLITTGEAGLITVWPCESAAASNGDDKRVNSASKNLKQKLNISHHRAKPY